MKGKSRGRKRKSTEQLSSPVSCSTDSGPVALTQNSCGKFIPKFSKKAKVQKTESVPPDSQLVHEEESSTQFLLEDLQVDTDLNGKVNEAEYLILGEKELITNETIPTSNLPCTKSPPNTPVSHDTSHDQNAYVPGLSLSHGIKEVECKIQAEFDPVEQTERTKEDSLPTNDDDHCILSIADESEKLDSDSDIIKETAVSALTSPKLEEGGEESRPEKLLLVPKDADCYQMEEEKFEKEESKLEVENNETKMAGNSLYEITNDASPLNGSINKLANSIHVLEKNTLKKDPERVFSAEVHNISNQPAMETVNHMKNLLPSSGGEQVTTMDEDGLGEIALQQLDDSLSLQDIEEMCLDFGVDGKVAEIETVKKLRCTPVKTSNSPAEVRLTNTWDTYSKIPTVPSISPRFECDAASTCGTPLIQDHTMALQGLVNELSMLNQYILKCKRELELARKERKVTKQNIWK